MATLSRLQSGEILEAKRGNRRRVRTNSSGYVEFSLKGAFREAAERVYTGKNHNTCQLSPANLHGCGHCILCECFGFGGQNNPGRFRFSFLISVKRAKDIVRTGARGLLDRETRTTPAIRLHEYIIDGAEFQARILIHSPQPEDLTILEAAIEYINQVGMGAGRTYGYGQVRMEIVSMIPLSHAEFLKKAEQKAAKRWSHLLVNEGVS
jgi:CRISPR/Cas system CSM-associated protein Csm3 (group 7 of RAMP superfamily)